MSTGAAIAIGLAVLLLVVAPAFLAWPWHNHNRISNLEKQVEALQQKVDGGSKRGFPWLKAAKGIGAVAKAALGAFDNLTLPELPYLEANGDGTSTVVFPNKVRFANDVEVDGFTQMNGSASIKAPKPESLDTILANVNWQERQEALKNLPRSKLALKVEGVSAWSSALFQQPPETGQQPIWTVSPDGDAVFPTAVHTAKVVTGGSDNSDSGDSGDGDGRSPASVAAAAPSGVRPWSRLA